MAFAAAVMITISMFTSGSVAIWSLVLCGFLNSIMFPNIFTLGIAGLGPMTSKGSGLIMTAVVGGAVIPYLIGALADKLGSIQQLLHYSGNLLSLHRLLRNVGIEADTDGGVEAGVRIQPKAKAVRMARKAKKAKTRVRSANLLPVVVVAIAVLLILLRMLVFVVGRGHHRL